MENVTLTPKEQTRLKVLNSLLAEHMTLDQAATLMGVSPRHTRRILAAYQEKGAATVAHGLRGRKPANATPEPVATAVVHLARTRYALTNHTHLSELLSDRDGIDIGRTTLRRILVNAGLSSPRRRRQPKHRVRRQRMPRRLWRSCKDWPAGCRCGMRDASSPPRRRHPVRYFSGTATEAPKVFLSDPPAPTDWANTGSRLSNRWTQGQRTRMVAV